MGRSVINKTKTPVVTLHAFIYLSIVRPSVWPCILSSFQTHALNLGTDYFIFGGGGGGLGYFG